MEKISVGTISALSETEQLYLYLFAFEESERKIGDFSFAMRARFGKQMTAAASDQICRVMAARGILRCTADCATVASRRYALAVRLSFDAARTLIVTAKKRKWLPAKENDILMLASIPGGGAFAPRRRFPARRRGLLPHFAEGGRNRAEPDSRELRDPA